MNRLFDTDTDRPDTSYSEPDPSTDREISLGTGTILGIFFGLALVCAAFFAFGYTLGRRSIQPATPSIISKAPSTIPLIPVKPAAGSSDAPRTATEVTLPEPATDTAQSSPAAQTPAPAGAPAKSPATLLPPAPAISPAGAFMVQVAAVSSPDIANILINSLKTRGYTVAIHHEPQDQLLHVQIGPFATREEAEAMRDHVLADGFNAIVK